MGACTALAIDTEFERTKTFFPNPGLLQVNDGSDIYLIDPITIDDFDPLFEVLSKSDVTIIMHASKEDLEVFRSLSDIRISNLWDTQIAASLLGFDSQLGYQALCKQVLDEEVDKGETRSDWIGRPLTEKQKDYAAIDVVHLLKLKDVLHQMLELKGRMAWFVEETANLEAAINAPKADAYYKKIKGTGRLSQMQLHGVYHLSLWREEMASKKNIPRGFIVKDKALLGIAICLPNNKQEMSSVEDLPPSFIKRFGEAVIALLEKIKTSEFESSLEQKIDLGKRAQTLTKEIKVMSATFSDDIAVSKDVLLPNRLVSNILQTLFNTNVCSTFEAYDKEKMLQDIGTWRSEVLSESLIPLLRNANS